MEFGITVDDSRGAAVEYLVRAYSAGHVVVEWHATLGIGDRGFDDFPTARGRFDVATKSLQLDAQVAHTDADQQALCQALVPYLRWICAPVETSGCPWGEGSA